MVTPTARRDRGQVILIGAITLAFILLGIVVVFNGVLYTETLSSSATSQSTADADMTMDGVERNLVEIAHRGNMNGNWSSRSDFVDEINSSGFADQYRNTTANSRAAMVNVSVNSVKEGDAVFRNETTGNITPISESGIEHFSIELNASKTDNLTIESNRTSGGSDNITIESENNNKFKISDDSGNPPCTVDNRIVRFDLVDGTTNISPVTSCELSIIERDEPYSEVVFINGSTGGKYDIVTKKKISYPSSSEYSGVWRFDATITYESNQVSYERKDAPIKVYGDNG